MNTPDQTVDRTVDQTVDQTMPLPLTKRERLFALCRSQLRVGCMGFGGPLATMSYMRDELVTKKKLVSDNRYLEGLGVVKLLPGPVSTLLAVFLGQEIAGTLGGLLGGICYILPAFFMLLGVCYFESHLPKSSSSLQHLSQVMGFLQATVIGMILWTCWKLFEDCLARKYFGRDRKLAVVVFALAAMLMVAGQVSELIILVSCAAGGFFLQRWLARSPHRNNSVSLLSIFFTYYVAGLTVFGTGYMVLPYLQRVLVDDKGWISTAQFLNGVAYGNLTPGPVVIASTYFGFQTLGLAGAVAATLGIFGGPIMLMLLLGPHLRKYLGRDWVEGLLLGLLPAVAATIALSLIPMSKAIAWTPLKIAVLIAAIFLSWRRVASWKLLLSTALLALLVG